MKMTIDYAKRAITLTYFKGEEEERDVCLETLQCFAITSKMDAGEDKYRIQYSFTSDFSENGPSVIEIKPASWMTSFDGIVRDCRMDLERHLRAVESTVIIPWTPWALLPWVGTPACLSLKNDHYSKLE